MQMKWLRPFITVDGVRESKHWYYLSLTYNYFLKLFNFVAQVLH